MVSLRNSHFYAIQSELRESSSGYLFTCQSKHVGVVLYKQKKLENENDKEMKCVLQVNDNISVECIRTESLNSLQQCR